MFQAVGKHELAPPRQADWPAIKADWAKVQSFIQTGAYKNLSVRVSIFLKSSGSQHTKKNKHLCFSFE